VIAEQVEMGVAVRMAVMETLLVSQNQGPRSDGMMA
jgi:aspartate carbamoyltransferase catalytic subunit